MMNIEPDASHTPDVLRDVLEEIEVLRMKRQEEGRGHPQNRQRFLLRGSDRLDNFSYMR